MKSVTLLVLVMVAGCMKQTIQNSAEPSKLRGNNQQGATRVSPTPLNDVATTAEETEENRDPPPAFAGVDFRNFSYPTNLRGKVTLRDGTRIYENPDGGGGDTFEFRDVNYADITGDGKDEAIVQLLLVSCGGSCDGGSHLFYFYSATQNTPGLLSRIETGSAAYDECGLKSFVLSQKRLTMELFRICRYRGNSFQSLHDANQGEGKFAAHSFTRFQFEFAGRRFAQKKRSVFPFTEGDVMNYPSTFSVRN